MGFLKNIIRSAVSDGISKGIRDAVSAAAEKTLAPKAEAYAGKMADSLDSAAGKPAEAPAAEAGEQKSGLASLQASLERLSQSAEKYAAELEKGSPKQEELAKMWNEKVPGFPVWCFGGTDFWFQESGTDANGSPYYSFCAENATPEGLELYFALLKRSGFVRKFATSDETLYKDLGGEYLVINKTTAFETAPTMMLFMCRTKDRSEIEI